MILQNNSVAMSLVPGNRTNHHKLVSALADAFEAYDPGEVGTTPAYLLLGHLKQHLGRNKTKARSFQQACREYCQYLECLFLKTGWRSRVPHDYRDFLTVKMVRVYRVDNEPSYLFQLWLTKARGRNKLLGDLCTARLKNSVRLDLKIARNPANPTWWAFGEDKITINGLPLKAEYNSAREEIDCGSFKMRLSYVSSHVGLASVADGAAYMVPCPTDREQKIAQRIVDAFNKASVDTGSGGHSSIQDVKLGGKALVATIDNALADLDQYRAQVLQCYKEGDSLDVLVDDVAINAKHSFMQIRTKLSDAVTQMDTSMKDILEASTFAEEATAESGVFDEVF